MSTRRITVIVTVRGLSAVVVIAGTIAAIAMTVWAAVIVLRLT